MLAKFLKKHFLVAAYLAFYFFAIAYRLAYHPTPFYDWDESLYVQTGIEMFKKRYFLFPVWQGEAWLDKPPLVPFLYGLVSKIFYFVQPEVSTRLLTLIVALTVLLFIYFFYFKVLKDKLLATLTVIATSFIPIFLQRAQVVNLDIFLLFGWLGYILFFERTIASFAFLFIAVFSKSLIGFYPAAIMFIYFIYLYLIKKVDYEELKNNLSKITVQVLILLGWFISMTVLLGNKFFKQHIIESHFRRVTSSIEFHFGARTFYIDLAASQLGIVFYLSLLGLAIILYRFFKNRLTPLESLRGFFLLPWFIFLNLTKTKIFWYLYPAIPQFAFLAVYPLSRIRKRKALFYFLSISFALFLLYNSIFTKRAFAQNYSKWEPHHELSVFAKDRCDSLNVLVDKQTRKSFDELDKLGLLITTTKWWGSHPSMIYYFGKKVNIAYSEKEFADLIKKSSPAACVVLSTEDLVLKEVKNLKQVKEFESLHLLKP